jgi:hypothetical protein
MPLRRWTRHGAAVGGMIAAACTIAALAIGMSTPGFWQPQGAKVVFLAHGCRFSPIALHLAVADRDSGYLPIFLARGATEMDSLACNTARDRLEGFGWVLGRILPDTLVCERIRSAFAQRYYGGWSESDEAGALPKWIRDGDVIGVGVSRPMLALAGVSGSARPVLYLH